ncbi:ABC transporter substrate-binding protein [Candidatus Sumerlaeota bacterium]
MRNKMQSLTGIGSCAAAAILLLATGCGGSDPGTSGATTPAVEKKLVVGFSQIGAESEWRTAETVSIKAEAEARKDRLTLKFSDASNKQEDQIRALRTFIVQNVDVILLAPKVKTGWEPVLKEIKRAGIPVIIVDREITVSDESLYLTRLGPDCVEEGRIAGRWLATALERKGKVIELQGTPGSAPAIARKDGFAEIIAQHPDIEIIASQSGDFRRSKGKEVMEALLKKHGKDFQALYAHNDDMAIGAIQALEEEGLNPGKDIIVVSIDGVRGAFQAMVDKKLNCTVECTPLYGPLAFDTAEKAAKGEALERWIRMPTRLFEQSEAATLIDGRKY